MLAFGGALRFGNVINSCRSLLTTSRQNVIPLHNSSAGVKTLEERLGMPPRPKRPLTPYFRFMKQVRSAVSAENPKANLQEIVKLVAQKWEKVDEVTKKRMQDEYKEEQLAYIEVRAKYDSKLTDDQRIDLKHLKDELAEAKEKRASKRKVRELGKPKKPASAFLSFLSKERTANPQGKETYREWHQKASERWTRMSDADKLPYVQETKKEFDKYKQALAKWEEKMIRLGHIDVVRQEALIIEQPKETTPKAKKKPTKTE